MSHSTYKQLDNEFVVNKSTFFKILKRAKSRSIYMPGSYFDVINISPSYMNDPIYLLILIRIQREVDFSDFDDSNSTLSVKVI